MATKYEGPIIPTPQDVLARVRQQREQQLASGNMVAQTMALNANALDALFGNPHVRQASRVNAKVAAATRNLRPVDGEDEVDTELRRLVAIRDATAEDAPEVSQQVQNQILQLGQVKLERAKLAAQTRQAETGATKNEAQTVGAQVTAASKLAQEGREQELHPLRVQNAQVDVEQGQAATDASRAAAAASRSATAARDAERTNWLGPDGTQKSVLNRDLSEQARLAAEGWVQMGNPQLTGSREDLGLTKPVQTTLQEAVLNAQQQKDTLARIAQGFKPEFLTIPKQVAMATDAQIERWTGKSLNAKIVADREQYNAWSRNVLGGLNEYIKYITGAQAAVAEYERIEKAYLSKSLSPTQFVSSLRELSRHTLAAEKRAQLAMQNGLQMNAEQLTNCQQAGKPCPLDAIPLPAISDAEVDGFLVNFGIPPRKTNTTNAPFKPFRAPNGAVVLEEVDSD